jgi:hypothetical protein
MRKIMLAFVFVSTLPLFAAADEDLPGTYRLIRLVARAQSSKPVRSRIHTVSSRKATSCMEETGAC